MPLRDEEELRAKIQKIKESGQMAFGDVDGAYETGIHDALLWALKEKEEI